VKSTKPPPWTPRDVWLPNNCAIVQTTGDGVSVGRCWHYLHGGLCTIHGDVTAEQSAYIERGEVTKDVELYAKRRAAHG
jgi:hypothetical protein